MRGRQSLRAGAPGSGQGTRLLTALLALAVAVGAQGEAQKPPPGQQGPAQQGSGVRADVQGGVVNQELQRLDGLPVRSIQVLRLENGPQGAQPRLVDQAKAESLVRSLETRVGRPFEPRKVSADCENLWHERRMVTSAWAREVDGQVALEYLIEREVETYERVEFLGNDKLTRTIIDSLLGIQPGRQITSSEAEAMRKVLLARYHRDGYAFCDIELVEKPADTAAGANGPHVLQFRIDEGPKVTVRDIHVIGNRSFQLEPNLGFLGTGNYLLRDSHILSDPAGWGRGGAYSREILEEDLDRLRLFYRGRGFLDATVDLADVQFSADRTEVDLVIVVVEGPQYSIRSVKIQHVDAANAPLAAPPLYTADEIQQNLRVKPGEFYDHLRLQRDWLAIQEFYGRRGHPPRSFPGNDVPTACYIKWPPRETYGDGPEVDVTFLVYEGKPKTLRDVLIRGNTNTRDAVIRRRIRTKLGERIDMKEIDRSLRQLEQTRYFTDEYTMVQPRMRFEPVPGSDDELDLAVDLQEGRTGELRWGVGISTGQGAQAQLTYSKRNFDLWNPPSSINPVTAISEMLDNRAFHGGGQTLDVLLAPGSRYSQFRLSWLEPDVFGDHFDTWDLRVAGQRLIRREPNGFTSDSLGADIGIGRSFTENFNLSLALREDSVVVKDLAPDATVFAYDAQGQTELRGLRLTARYRDLDDLRRPSAGLDLSASGELVGGFLGGEESLLKFVHNADVYVPLASNEMDHKTVLQLQHMFGYAQEFGGSNDVFLTERFYMGGRSLRGFDYRGAGPTQFGRPVGGEAIYTATAEVTFPLVATRLENDLRDREILRFAVFTDLGLLGLGINTPDFGQVRLATGFGIRIEIPGFEIPIALDFAWPWLYEETDSRRQFSFSIYR